jgi:hypothetical protein
MATLIRKTTTVVETVEVVVAAPVPMPRTVTAPARQPAPALDSKPTGPKVGHIVRVTDQWANRPGGRLPVDQWKVEAIRRDGTKVKVVGLLGTAAAGRCEWVYVSEVTYLRG